METRDPETPTTDTDRERPAAPRRMKRSREDRMIGGVCAGIARYFDIDPVIVRVVTIALVAAGGVGAVTYVAAWILMPLDDQAAAAMPSATVPASAHPAP